jgi:DNA invertase Pin-like site-specific DNA recombinase
MIIGYARVSTEDQKLDMQIDALKKYGCDKIFTEKGTGTRKERPQLQEMMKILRQGDTVVVWKLDRISRSTKHLIELVEHFEKQGVHFVSIQDNIDTTTATGRFFFRVMASIAELERDIIAERTRQGLASARARGRKGGRPRVKKEQIELALKMYKSKEYTLKEIVKATGVAQSTIYNYLKKDMS